MTERTRRRVLPHTADAGLEAWSPTMAGLIEELAHGMWELVAPIEPCEGTQVFEETVTSGSPEDLVVDSLSAVLTRAEVEGLVPCRVRVEATVAYDVTLRVAGVPAGRVRLTGAPIKAVTYHDLVVAERDGGWYGRVFFDV